MTVTNSTIAGILKVGGYNVKQVDTIVVKDRPLLQLITREKDFFTQEVHVPIATGNNQNVSADVSVAIAGTADTLYDKFMVTPVKFYGYGKIDGLVAAQAKQGSLSDHFVDALKNEFDSVLETMGQRIAKQAYGNRGGSIARIASISTTTVTLTNKASAIYFSPGMVIASATTDGTSGALTNGGSTVVVSAVDIDAGTVTASSNWSTITGIAAGDYLFAKGDFGALAAGLDDWNPISTSGLGTAFYGATRSSRPDRYAGGRYNGSTSGATVDTVLQLALRSRVAQGRGRPDFVMMHPNDLGKLEATKEGTKIASDKAYNLGVEAFQVHGIKIVEDFNCPEGIARFLTKAGFSWRTCGSVPMIDSGDGLTIRLSPSSDSYELRAKAYHNFLSRKPHELDVVVLPT